MVEIMFEFGICYFRDFCYLPSGDVRQLRHVNLKFRSEVWPEGVNLSHQHLYSQETECDHQRN